MNKKDLEIILTIGIPASGKSSWAIEYIKQNPNYIRVSRDDFRYMFKGIDFCENKIENLITDITNEVISKALKNNLNVIVDNTNVKLSNINEFISLFNFEANINYKIFDTPLKECIERDFNREKPVGVDVIKRMYNNFEILKKNFNFEPICKITDTKERFYLKQNINLPKAIIIDIDGTLALNYNRYIHDEEKVYTDTVNEPVANFVRQYKGFKIITSGRKDSCRKETERWLKDNLIEFDYLFMRKSDDNRKDSVIKREIFENNIRNKFYIECCYEDRDQIVSLWREMGLLCLQVYYGNF